MLTLTPLLLDGRRLLCTIAHSAMTYVLCTCILSLCLRLASRMYISALTCAVGTPSEFSSVPILVADELAKSSSCETTILGNYPISNPLSLERLPCNCDLAIRVATTRNIRTRFPKYVEHTGGRPNHPRRLRNRKRIPHRDISPTATPTNAPRTVLPYYVLHRTKHRTRTASSSVGFSQSSVDTPKRSTRTT